MPELPEVETVRRQLARIWEGQTIVQVEAAASNYFFVSSPALLKKRLVGRKTLALRRHGKYLVAEFDDSSRLLLHLGMTGQFVAHALPQDGHVHLVLHLSGQRMISFRDVRKFGKVEWIAARKSSARLDKLGPDALEVSVAHLRSVLSKRRVAIKSAILDQGVLAGVGNIYADEALFAARIHPTRPAHLLSLAETKRLHAEIIQVLLRSLEQGGSTINDYMRPDGELGGFQDWHQVYGKTAEPCPRCKKPLSRIVLGGRGTHYCEKCQR